LLRRAVCVGGWGVVGGGGGGGGGEGAWACLDFF